MCSDPDSNDSNEDPFARIADCILTKKAKRIIVLVGAGISTDSGIPDFRTPGTGLYDNLSQYKLPWPEAVFDLNYFHSNPVPFYTLAKELYPSGKYKPNISHYFIRLLQEKSMLLRTYTQNIDSLERMAGVASAKLIEAHGSFLSATCTVCQAKASRKVVKNAIDRSAIAKCVECGNVVKPDIVFFSEELPERFWQYQTDIYNTDLVFIMGTSLEVYPFADVADDVPKSVTRVLFNREMVGSFRRHNRPNDIAVLGSITDSIKRLAKKLNWYEELQELMKQAPVDLHATINNKSPAKDPKRPPSVNQKRNFATQSTSHSTNRLAEKLSTITLNKAGGSKHRQRDMSPNCSVLCTVRRNHSRTPFVSTSSTHHSKRTPEHQTKQSTRKPTSRASLSSSSQQSIPLRPQPRNGLAVLHQYSRRSPIDSSDTDSSGSGYSFLKSSPDSESSTHNDGTCTTTDSSRETTSV